MALALARPCNVQMCTERTEAYASQHIPGMHMYIIQIDCTSIVRQRVIVSSIAHTFVRVAERVGRYPLERTIVDITSRQQQTLLHDQMHHLSTLDKA
uniref:Uncharacterized protein n=1 Tax=Anopheles funestus TaxID=62324 RepID=A0A182RHM7_ANOFN